MNLLCKIICLNLIIFLCSCDKDDTTTEAKSCTVPSSQSNGIMIGSNDWILFTNTNGQQQDINESTVAQVKIPAMLAACTGFLINADTLMTNNHCIGSSSAAANATALFRNASGARESFSCNQFIMTSAVYDFTLVKCTGSPGLKYGWVGLNNVKPVINAPIYLVQENCDYYTDPRCVVNKYLSFGVILQSKTSSINHDADTLGGSSGSPIFSEDTHQVIAIHNTGSPATSSSPAMNGGVPMNKIISIIQTQTNVTLYEFGSAGNNGSVITPDPSPGSGGNSSPDLVVASLENCQ